MRLLIDQDEVLADFLGGLFLRWNEIHGTGLTRADVREWNLTRVLGPEAKEWIIKTLSHPRFFAELSPMPGAIDGMTKLRDRGHDMMIVTHVDPDITGAFDGKREWVRQHLPWLPLKNVVFATRKELVDGEALVDDAPHNIELWAGAGKRGAIVFDAPWNRNVPVLSDGHWPIGRAVGWKGVVEQVDSLDGEMFRRPKWR